MVASSASGHYIMSISLDATLAVQVYGWLQRLQDEPAVSERLQLPLLLPLLQTAG